MAPPVAQEAAAFFAARGCGGFETVPGPARGWRCRAKLAVRGAASAPSLGLFEAGTHQLVPIIPGCVAHHPRLNEAALLVQRAAAALRVAPYQERQAQAPPWQQQREHQQHQDQQQRRRRPRPRHSHPAGAGGGEQAPGGGLRYVQLTALPSAPGGRAEDDPQACVQVALVWAAPGASHPSAADARRLAAAIWSQGGPRAESPLAQLRARSEAAAAAAAAARAPSRASQRQRPQPPHEQQQPLLHSVWLNFQPSEDNAIFGPEWQLLHGPEWGWQDFGGVEVAVGASGFVQANFGAMREALGAIAASTPHGSSVLELYAGTGAIGLSLAARGAAGRVLCAEVNPASAAAFEATRARLAAVDPEAARRVEHVVASAGDAAELRRLLERSDPDVLVVDPPRRGLDAAVIDVLTAGGGGGRPAAGGGPRPSRLVYLSCGFPALRRDTDALLAAGWRLASARALLFFPGTDSIETLAVFEAQRL